MIESDFEALGHLAEMVTDKISSSELTIETYISTENMVPNKGGVQRASKLPTTAKVNAFMPGDVLFSNIRTYFKKVWLANCHGGASADVIIFRPLDKQKIDNHYLFYVLSNDPFIASTVTASKGTKMPRGDKHAMSHYKVRLPTTLIQKRIATILSAYDDLIEKNLRRIKILEEMAQNLYREWFVKFRFPGHEHARMVDSPLGKIPEGWVAATLSDLVSIRKGKNITKKTIVPGNVPVVAGGITPAYYHNAANTQNPVITISASGANAGFVNLYYEDVWASDCSVIDSGVTRHVYYFNLLLKERQYEVTRLQRGAAQPHVYPKDLMALEVCAAPDEVLEMFGSQIEPIFRMIRNLKSRNNNLRQTRDLLLPKLISGELDVSKLDIYIGDAA